MLSAVQSLEADSNAERRDALEAFLDDLGVPYQPERFTIEPRSNYPRREGVNLVVTIGEGERDILIGGHYDAAFLPDGRLSRGAVDNGASVAILARLAAMVMDERFRHRLRVVFFDMEEIGLIGSRQYVMDHAGDRIVAAVNLDVNGYGDTIFYGPSAETGNEKLYGVMREHCVASSIDCVEAPAYPDSDYESFQAAGIPNISFSIFPAVEARELWLFLNGGRGAFAPGFLPDVFRTIHTSQDTSARVEPGALDLGLDSLVGYVRRIDRELDPVSGP